MLCFSEGKYALRRISCVVTIIPLYEPWNNAVCGVWGGNADYSGVGYIEERMVVANKENIVKVANKCLVWWCFGELCLKCKLNCL